MNKAQQLLTLRIGMVGFSSILLTTNVFPFQLTSIVQNKQALLPALQSGQQAIDQTIAESDQGVASFETTTPATQEEIAIRQQQVNVARQYENAQQRSNAAGIARRSSVIKASLVRIDYEIELLQAKQSFEEAIALREQQVEVAKEYEALRHQALQAGVETIEDTWDASFDRWEYELKLVQEKQVLQDM